MQVDKNICLYCGGCVGVCPQDAMELRETILFISPEKCNDCGICEKFCPSSALKKEVKNE